MRLNEQQGVRSETWTRSLTFSPLTHTAWMAEVTDELGNVLRSGIGTDPVEAYLDFRDVVKPRRD
jgi:hypothetical protein